MLTPQLRRISQLDPLTTPTSQLSGAVMVWDVPMGPVAGGYKTMRGTPEDLAAYLALGALLKRLGLPGARALLAGVAPQPVVDGGVLYAIEDSRWNGGPGATVYVHGLDSGQFAPVGYGPVAGKMVLVNVDIAAGKYTEFVSSAKANLLTTAREDVFVDPTYAIPATYLNTALTLRTYNQASVAVTLPALTPQLVPALLRIEHQTGLGGNTCLLRVPGVARPLRVGEYVLLAATATPAIPPNSASGYPGAPAGTAWVELNASAQLLDPLSYPVMVGTRSLGYVGYPTLEAAAFAAPFRPLVVNVPSLLISKDMAITGNLYSAGTQLIIEDGVTLSIGMGLTLHKVGAVANGSGKVQLTSTQSGNVTPTANQALQLVDSIFNLPVVFSAAAHGVTLRGASALAAPQGSTGVAYLYDLAEGISAGGPTVVDRRPGAASGGSGGGGGIDYANPAPLTGASTIIAASTLYVLSGSDFTVSLPAGPAPGFRVRIKVAANAAGLYTVSGNGAQIGGVASRTMWADEGLELVYSNSAWLVLSDEAKKALIRCESTPAQTVALPAGQTADVPLTTQVLGSTPFAYAGTLVTCRRAGVVRVDLSVVLQGVSPAGFYQINVEVQGSSGPARIICIGLVPAQDAGGGAYYGLNGITGKITVAAGDVIRARASSNGGGYYRYDAPQPAILTISEE